MVLRYVLISLDRRETANGLYCLPACLMVRTFLLEILSWTRLKWHDEDMLLLYRIRVAASHQRGNGRLSSMKHWMALIQSHGQPNCHTAMVVLGCTESPILALHSGRLLCISPLL